MINIPSDDTSQDCLCKAATSRHDSSNEESCLEQDNTELVRIRQAMHVLEQKYEAVFRRSPSQIAFHSLDDGTLVDASDSFFEFFGYSREEMIGRSHADFEAPVDIDKYMHCQEILAQTGSVRDVEFRIRVRSGAIKHCIISADVVEIDGAKYVLAKGIDITNLRKAEERSQKALDALEKAYQLQTDFLNTVTHEIRTPLTSVLGYVRMLMEGAAGPLNQEQTQLLKNVLVCSDTLLRLADSALEMTRFKRGRAILKSSFCNPVDIVKETIATFIPECEKHHIDLQMVGGNGRSGIYDAQKLSVTLSNLLSNAIKFNRNGKVTVSAEADSNGTEIIIVDTGCGIPGDRLADVFDEFSQLNEPKKHKPTGFGVGLTVVAAMVEIMGASLVMSSEQGIGTAVTLMVPALKAD